MEYKTARRKVRRTALPAAVKNARVSSVDVLETNAAVRVMAVPAPAALPLILKQRRPAADPQDLVSLQQNLNCTDGAGPLRPGFFAVSEIKPAVDKARRGPLLRGCLAEQSLHHFRRKA